MIFKTNGRKCLLLALTAFNVVLLIGIVRRFHFKNQQQFKRMSRNFTQREIWSTETVQFSTPESQTVTKPQSAFELFGLANEQLMQKMNVKRSLFNFTLTPWKMFLQPKASRHYNWSMIVVVKSNGKNQIRRKTTRTTWASLTELLGVQIKTVFIVGSAKDLDGEMDLLKENQEFGDLLQIDVLDEYKLVGMKTLAGMQWVVQNFPSHWMYTSADDDMLPDLINIFKDIEKMMQEQLEQRSKLSSSTSKYSKEIITCLPIHCGFFYSDKPTCLRSTKWAVKKEEYSLPTYPSFCHGGWYSMPVSLAHGLYEISREHEFFRLDDVWVTSLLRVTYFHELGVGEYFGLNASDYHIGIRKTRAKMARHGQASEMYRVWNYFKLKLEKMNITIE